MPGVLAGLIGALMAAIATEKEYGERYLGTFHLLSDKIKLKKITFDKLLLLLNA